TDSSSILEWISSLWYTLPKVDLTVLSDIYSLAAISFVLLLFFASKAISRSLGVRGDLFRMRAFLIMRMPFACRLQRESRTVKLLYPSGREDASLRTPREVW